MDCFTSFAMTTGIMESRAAAWQSIFEDAGKTHGLLHFVRNDNGTMESLAAAWQFIFEDAGKTHGLLHFVRNNDGIMAKWPQVYSLMRSNLRQAARSGSLYRLIETPANSG